MSCASLSFLGYLNITFDYFKKSVAKTLVYVSERNGVITGYIIKYGVGTNRKLTITTPSSATTHLITSLKPFTNYTFTVAGVNSVNRGPFSGSSEIIRTSEESNLIKYHPSKW